MKRNLRKRILTTLPIACALTSSAFAQIRVEVDGNLVHFNDTQPRMVDGRVLVPLRGVLEQMGANVFWDPSRRLVTARQGQKDISMYIGQRSAMVDGRTVTLDVPAMIIGGSTMVPLRFMSESLGADVMWLSSSQTVRIDTALDAREPGPPPPPARSRAARPRRRRSSPRSRRRPAPGGGRRRAGRTPSPARGGACRRDRSR